MEPGRRLRFQAREQTLVVWWLRPAFPMQAAGVPPLVRELDCTRLQLKILHAMTKDSTRATKIWNSQINKIEKCPAHSSEAGQAGQAL